MKALPPIGFFVILLLLLGSHAAQALTSQNLRCEYRTEPLGIDTTQPRLSWTSTSTVRADRQTAYQIIVASSTTLLASGTGDLWDSGQVASTQQNSVLYAGTGLQSSQKVFWKVRTWDASGAVSSWSADATWTLGMLKSSDWQAQWIMGVQRKSIGYLAQTATAQATTKWVQTDLGAAYAISSVVLHPKWYQGVVGYGFPVRFKVQVSNDPTFATATTVADQTAADYVNPGYIPVPFSVASVSARYVRVTATKLYYDSTGNDYTFALSQLEVVSNASNVALNASVSAEDTVEQSGGWGAAGLTDGAGFVGCDYGRRLRREFTVKSGLTRAVVQVCGLGEYELSVNGTKHGGDVISPGWSAYAKTCLYDTRDITTLLQTGTNAVGLVLGNSMYNIGPGYGRYVKFQNSFGQLRAIAQIRLEYNDGTSQTIISDPNWQSGPGAITFENVYAGEDYDARLEPAGWSQPGFTSTRWTAAVATTGPGGTLKGLSCAAPLLGKFDVFTPISSTVVATATTVYDLGQNAAVMPNLQVTGPAGSVVRIIPSELLGSNGQVDRTTCTEDSTPPLPSWWQYTLKGSGSTESWAPQFFYHGSRYFQVQCYPAPGGTTLPTVQLLRGVAVHSTSTAIGTFSCSNPLFNRIYNLVRWAEMSNMVSYLTDCPHRERQGWLEETHLNGPALRYSFDLTPLFAKIENDMADTQNTSNGFVSTISPQYFQTSTSLTDPYNNSPEWGSAFILGAWQQYQYSGDVSLLQRFYPAMKAYFAFLTSEVDSNYNFATDLGDWYDTAQMAAGNFSGVSWTTKSLTGSAIYYDDARSLAGMAQVLGNSADAATYTQTAANIRTGFNTAFFKTSNSTYDTSSQTANSVPLALGMVDAANVPSVTAAIVSDIQSRGNTLTSGEIGFGYLLRALTAQGRADLVYTMNNRSDTPGYGYQLAQGATSLTERWDALNGSFSSQDHFMLGEINEWLYHDLAGIQLDPANPAFKNIIIKPCVVGDLTSAGATYQSVQGAIANQWTISGGQLTMNVTIPVGSTATIYVPTANAATVMEGNTLAANAPGVTYLGTGGGYASYAVGSGNYAFTSTPVLGVSTITGATATRTTAALTWTTVPTASTYSVKRSTTSGGPYTTIATNLTGTSYTDTGLTVGTTYYYVVTTMNSTGVGNDSAEFAVTVWFVPNGGFETPPTTGYAYAPAGGSWTFSAQSGSNGAGVAQNGSAFGNPVSPDGTQTAFVQGTGSITQTVTGLTPGATYAVTFAAAQRGGYINGGQTWNATVDGGIVASYAPGTSATAFQDYSFLFKATAASHTLGFVGTDLNTGDNTVFIDNVRMTTTSAGALINGGFEAPITAAYSYGAPGGSWTFTAQSGSNGTGVSANGSAYTSGNAAAPEGKQVAFIQGTGTIAQLLVGLTSGATYTVTFSAAERAVYINGGQTWNVTLDGSTLASYSPGASSTAYKSYTASFVASSASQTLAFVGTNTKTGDNTVFIDNVLLNAAVPAAVAGLRATAGNRQVSLAWGSVSGVTGYHLTRTVGTSSTTLQINGTGTSYLDAGLVNGTTYVYKVSGFNEAGDGVSSNVVSATPVSPPVSAVEQQAPQLSLTADGSGGWNVSVATITSVAGHTYQLQSVDDLVNGTWQAVPGVAAQAGNGAALQFSAPVDASVKRRFYRIVITLQ